MSAPDHFLPLADETVVEHVVVDADASRAYEAIGAADVSSDRLVGLWSGLEDAWSKRAGRQPSPKTLDGLLAADVGPVELAAEPGIRRVIGIAGRYHPFERRVAHLRPDEFDGFQEPGSLKAAVAFTLTPQADGRTLLGCEVRVRATDDDTRSALGMTWFAAGLGVRLAARRLLEAIRIEAER